jgi:hypothetical protein
MIEESALSLADRRLSANLVDRQELTGSETTRIKAAASAAGRFQSGSTLLSISKLYESEIGIQGMLAWQILHECIIAANIDFGAKESATAKDWISKKLAASAAEMKRMWAEDKSLQFTKIIPFETRLDEAVQRALDKTAADIDLYALACEKAGSSEAPKAAVIIQNVGTIQALQTGAGSVANVSQSFTQTDRAPLLAALETVRSALETLDATQHPGKNNVLEMVAELATEAEKERPNKLKIASGLSTVGQSISTVAALKPAYDTVKGLAAMFGINLP